MGVGLLSVPLSLSKSGYAGVLVLWLLAVTTNYTGKTLCRCAATVTKKRKLPRSQMIRYEDVAFEAFGIVGKRVVATIMYTELLGTCALLLILESDNLWNLLGPGLMAGTAPALGGLTQWLASQQAMFWAAVVLVIPTVCAPNVKSLSFLGLCGFVATLTVTATIAFLLVTGMRPDALLVMSMPHASRQPRYKPNRLAVS
jgi:solute carrier family 32 (vesicular inhibitory amino acid transporter)